MDMTVFDPFLRMATEQARQSRFQRVFLKTGQVGAFVPFDASGAVLALGG